LLSTTAAARAADIDVCERTSRVQNGNSAALVS
jgi:hypothetical protein